MSKSLKSLYVIFLLQLLTLHSANAILGGSYVNSETTKYKVVLFDVRVGHSSIVCTGSFISSQKLITAAHCLENLNNKCTHCKPYILINNIKVQFNANIHPNYKSKSTTDNYSDESNYDIAIIKLLNFKAKLHFDIQTELQQKTNFKNLNYYGYGMSQLKKEKNKDLIFYHESRRGTLKKGLILNGLAKKGLIKKENSLLTMSPKKHIELAKGSQVLRSDSGGPLIHDNRIIGIIRNYEIIDSVSEKQVRNISSSLPLRLVSTFTLFNDHKTLQFLKKHL